MRVSCADRRSRRVTPRLRGDVRTGAECGGRGSVFRRVPAAIFWRFSSAFRRRKCSQFHMLRRVVSRVPDLDVARSFGWLRSERPRGAMGGRLCGTGGSFHSGERIEALIHSFPPCLVYIILLIGTYIRPPDGRVPLAGYAFRTPPPHTTHRKSHTANTPLSRVPAAPEARRTTAPFTPSRQHPPSAKPCPLHDSSPQRTGPENPTQKSRPASPELWICRPARCPRITREPVSRQFTS